VPEASIIGVTVVGPSLGVADALATAIFADQAKSLDWLVRYPEYGIILFDAGGDVRWSSSLADIVEIPRPANTRGTPAAGR
jgi:thiamine biosynthesis lipoprotein ApbE